MKITDISDYFIPAYVDLIVKRTGGKLWPLQEKAVKKGLLDFKWKSFLASAPHGSGKTLVAELATVGMLRNRASAQILYLVPYKAMAQEIYEKFTFLQNAPYGRDVGIWTGDKAIDRTPLSKSNFLVLTYELFQLMLLNDLDSVMNASLIIIDELHFIEEPSRGSRQEAAITRFLTLSERPPVLALSPIVSNLDKLQEWLGCNSFFATSKERMGPLYEGIVNPDKLRIEFYLDGKKQYNEPLPIKQIGSKLNTLIESCVGYLQKDKTKKQPQVLIFAPNRADVRNTAQRISDRLREQLVSGNIDLSAEEIKKTQGLLKKITYSSNETIKNFYNLLSTGVAYHHAGLGQQLRTFIEQQFHDRRIIVLVSTTTLGIGVNLPASRVYFLETKAGISPITPIKYRNMAGRAGRPQFREKGESIIIATSELEMQSMLDEYISNHEPELRSYLLRNPSETEGALLAWISQGLSTISELERIVKRSFNPDDLDSDITTKLLDSLETLEKYGYITSEGKKKSKRYRCTVIGQSASTCGARPDDSSFLVLNLRPGLLINDQGEFDSLAALFCICLTSRFDGASLGKEKIPSRHFSPYITKIDRSSRIIPLSSRWRIPNAFFKATLLSKWVSGMDLKEIGNELKLDTSPEEIVERLVPNATEMLHYYLVIAENCGPANIGSTDQLIENLRVLRDCLELGTDTKKRELAQLFRGRPDARQLVQQLHTLGITKPEDLSGYPFEDFSEKTAKMKSSDFFYAKSRALLLISDIDERKKEYIQLFAKYHGVYNQTLSDLLSGPEKFEKGVRDSISQIADTWSDHLKYRPVRDVGAGSELPRPECYLDILNDDESRFFCFEAKTQKDGTPIGSHEKSLSVLPKCAGASTFKVTVGWPSFHKDLHAIASDRNVILLDSSTLALVYVWIKAGFMGIRKFLTPFNKTGIVMVDAFSSHIPRWWPRTQI